LNVFTRGYGNSLAIVYCAADFIAGTFLQYSELIAPLTYAIGADASLRQ
jgi:hypothetical protein